MNDERRKEIRDRARREYDHGHGPLWLTGQQAYEMLELLDALDAKDKEIENLKLGLMEPDEEGPASVPGLDTFRGWPIYQNHEDGEWLFSDTDESTIDTWRSRPCGKCGEFNNENGHDACLGTIPSAVNACCGHGDTEEAFIVFKDGARISGTAVEEYMDLLKDGQDMGMLVMRQLALDDDTSQPATLREARYDRDEALAKVDELRIELGRTHQAHHGEVARLNKRIEELNSVASDLGKKLTETGKERDKFEAKCDESARLTHATLLKLTEARDEVKQLEARVAKYPAGQTVARTGDALGWPETSVPGDFIRFDATSDNDYIRKGEIYMRNSDGSFIAIENTDCGFVHESMVYWESRTIPCTVVTPSFNTDQSDAVLDLEAELQGWKDDYWDLIGELQGEKARHDAYKHAYKKLLKDVEASTRGAYASLASERQKQDEKWGPHHDDLNTIAGWTELINEYARRLRHEQRFGDDASYEELLVIVGALAVAAIESLRRKKHKGEP